MHAPIRHPLVEFDLRDASLWYDWRQPGLGARFDADAIDTLDRLVNEPFHYAVRFDDIRRANLHGFPHGIFFFIHHETVVILGVLHGVRDSQQVLDARRRTYA